MSDKIAIVTGAVKGIGRGIAEELAGQGISIVVADLKSDEADWVAGEIAAKYQVKASGYGCNMGNPSEIKAMVEHTVKMYGKLDIFVNNAGIYPFKPLTEITGKEWDALIDVNLRGSFISIQESAKVMKAGGKIVIISSIASIQGFAGLTHYCASKGGVNGLVRAAALELAPKKINVNAVAPGAIDTPGATGALDEKSKQAMIQGVPWKRWGQPADIANAVSFLASDKSDYITGQVIVVDGGWTIQ